VEGKDEPRPALALRYLSPADSRACDFEEVLRVIERLVKVINERGYFVLWFGHPQELLATHRTIGVGFASHEQPVLVLQETDRADFEEQARIAGWPVDPDRPGALYYRCTTD
jgi:hypothetical protein